MFSAGCCYFLCQRRGDFGSNPSCATGKSSYLSGPLFFLLWKISRLNQTIPRPPSSPSTVWFHEKNRNHSLSLRPFGGIKPVWKELPSMVKLSVCYTNFSIQRFKVHWSWRPAGKQVSWHFHTLIWMCFSDVKNFFCKLKLCLRVK